jgi:hypothetical protein
VPYFEYLQNLRESIVYCALPSEGKAIFQSIGTMADYIAKNRTK